MEEVAIAAVDLVNEDSDSEYTYEHALVVSIETSISTPTAAAGAWFIDSGATAHITYEAKDFVQGSFKCFATTRPIKVGDGRYVQGQGTGTVNLPKAGAHSLRPGRSQQGKEDLSWGVQILHTLH